MFDGYLRAITDKGVEPIGRGLARIGVTPDHLTVLGLVMAVATAVAIGSGHPFIGFFVLLSSALPDLFDGAVARASGTSSMRGAFFDSTADRVTDAFLLGGIGWYLGSTRGFRSSMLAFAVLGVSTLISYMRAKAEIYKLDAKGGLMERAERIIVLCVGLIFSQLLIPILWIMLVLTSITAVQRFVKIWNQADRPAVAIRPTASSRRADSARRRASRQSRVEGSLRLPRTKAEREQLLAEWRETRLARLAATGRDARTQARANRKPPVKRKTP
jgi:CDP-diacylglycerol---glycerol-3-phosphate 3-phosphatidyltransferase